MTLTTALIAYGLAAGLLTITPGLDTAMILRTAAVEGPRRGAMAALGILGGCLAWGAAVALGLGVVLAASRTAYTALRFAGAAYLLWLGASLILKPRTSFDLTAARGGGGANWWLRGFLNKELGT